MKPRTCVCGEKIAKDKTYCSEVCRILAQRCLVSTPQGWKLADGYKERVKKFL